MQELENDFLEESYNAEIEEIEEEGEYNGSQQQAQDDYQREEMQAIINNQ
jgi:hypothetical protein